MGLDAAPVFFLGEAPLLDNSWNLGSPSWRSLIQGLTEERYKTLNRLMAVRGLGSIFLRNDPENSLFVYSGAQVIQYQLLFTVRKARRIDDIKQECCPGADLVHILAARPAAARSGKPQLTQGDRNFL